MPDQFVVTGGNSRYFGMICDLADSLRAQRDADSLGLAVIDAGLTADERQHLASRHGAVILDVGWGFDIPESKIRGRTHLKAQTARSFLDQHLPQAQTIAWIDGDAWVQDMAPLDMMFAAAQSGKLVIVSQTSRYSNVAMTLGWAPLGFAKVKSILYKNARRSGLSEALARQIGARPTLNTGVFVLRRDAPHWDVWRRRQAEVVRKGRIFTSDQLSLALGVYIDGLPVELAPEICNYMGPWTCTEDETTLVERYIPHAAVGVVHMAGLDSMRSDDGATTPVVTLDGRVIDRSLRRGAWRP